MTLVLVLVLLVLVPSRRRMWSSARSVSTSSVANSVLDGMVWLLVFGKAPPSTLVALSVRALLVRALLVRALLVLS